MTARTVTYACYCGQMIECVLECQRIERVACPNYGLWHRFSQDTDGYLDHLVEKREAVG